MKVRIFALGALVVGISAGPAATQEVSLTANNVLDVCTRADMHWVDFCNGYFQGIVDAYGGVGTFCIPMGTTRTAIVTAGMAMLENTLRTRPEMGATNGATAVAAAISAIYPCR